MTDKRYIIPFFVPHIGCPHACVFCSQNKITGQEKPVTPGEILPTVKEYISTFHDKTRRIEIAFFGGSFTGIPMDMQRALLNEAYNAKMAGLIDGIRLSTRPDYINKKILHDLKAFGVDTVELGVQSMDNKVLALSQRGHVAADVVKSSKLIKNHGFKLGLQMMIGLPGSYEITELNTATEICALEPDFVRIYPALVIRGTKMETLYKSGAYTPLPLHGAIDICVRLTEIFIKERIKIIRMGLQPTDLISEGAEVIAGPFHPSFRQLVDAKLVLKVIVKIIEQRGMDLSRGLILTVNPRCLSTLQGINKANIKTLREMYPGLYIKTMTDETLKGNVLRLRGDRDLIETDYLRVIEKGVR